MQSLPAYRRSAPLSSGVHIPALDGLRGVAILLVMLYHQTAFQASTLLDRPVAFVLYGGWSGVDLFFVLSGFLITGILYDAKGSEGYFRNFYARRMLRIFPLYYAVVFFCFVVLPHFPHPHRAEWEAVGRDAGWYWLYLSNFAIGAYPAFRHGILDISWSLAIEEQFYLLWPLVVFALGRRRLMQVCVGLIVFAVAWRVGAVLLDAPVIATYVYTPARVDSLAVGALVALWGRGAEGLSGVARWARPVGIGAGAVLLALGVAIGGLDPFHPAMQTVGYTLFALLFGGVLVASVSAVPGSRLARVLDTGVLRTFGRYSYALYLFHLPLRAVIRDLVYGPREFWQIGASTLPGQIVFFVVSTVLTLAVAWLSWHLFERHFLELKRYFVYGPVRAVREVAPLEESVPAVGLRKAVG